MSRYLARLKALKLEMPLHEVLPKPTKPPFGSFVSDPDGHLNAKKDATEPVSVPYQIKEDALSEYLWRNPHPQGSQTARSESLRIIRAAQRGEPI